MISLVLEASTYAGSAALLDGSQVIAEASVTMRGRDSEALMPAVAELFVRSGLSTDRARRVVIGAGPGSFTSLRIAASIAKAICISTGAILVPVSSLALLAVARLPGSEGRVIASLDAMRGQHYVQEFEFLVDGVLSAGEMGIVPSSQLEDLAERSDAILIGPDREGDQRVVPSAGSARFLTNLIDASEGVDVAAWEPGYGRAAEAQIKWEAAEGRPLPRA